MSQADAKQQSTTTDPDDSGGEFDAERAMRTIEALREDLRKAKENQEPQSEKDARVIAGLKKQVEELTQSVSEVDLLRTKAQEAEEAAQETALSLHRERAARIHGLGEDQFEFLTELTDPEAIESRAEKLAAMTAKSVPARPVDLTQGSTAAGKDNLSTAEQFASAIDGAFTR